MLDLKWNKTTQETVAKKAGALVERFYLIVEANLTDITDHEFQDTNSTMDLQSSRTAKE